MSELLFKEESYLIVGICMRVDKILGKGFKEVVYKDAMEAEFKSLNIKYEREKPFDIIYKQQVLPHKFIADYFVLDKTILEVKATAFIHTDAFRQTLNYLKASPNIQ